MLIDFRVRNFRSVRDELVLSLVAAKDAALVDSNVVASTNKVVPNTLRSAVIYGPNASGKSNLVRALTFMRAFVAESATVVQAGQSLNVQAFRLDAAMADQPSQFEITFAVDGVRYQYGFALTRDRVVDEWLLVYKAAKAQQWFTRHWDAPTQTERYEFSAHLTGQRKLWQEATRPNALFLSTAVQLNSELLRPVFQWIVDQLVVFHGGPPLPDYSVDMAQHSEGAKAIVELLGAADISIAGIDVVKRKGFRQWLQLDGATGMLNTSRQDAEFSTPQFRHVTDAGTATFDLEDESLGTQHLFALAGPVLDILRLGRVLVVDELDSSLHTLLVRRLVEWFHNPALNPRGAQLIFTTHDTTLLDQTLFRRDQVWFIEKTRAQATHLYPLTDFSPRKGEALERGYLQGRYGAVPMLSDLQPSQH